MRPNAISLQPGASVLHGVDTWIIERPEGFDRVLAQRSSDGRREFLAVRELRQVPRSVMSERTGVDGSGELETPTAARDADELEPRAQEQQPNWRALIARERIRVMPDDRLLTPMERKKIADAVEEFQLLAEVLSTELPAERGKMMRDIAAAQGYSQATAYRRLEIIRVWQCADALMHKPRSDRGRLRLTDKQLEIIDSTLLKYRFVETPRTIPRILELVNGLLRSSVPAEKEISRTTLYERLNLTSRRDQLLAAGRKEEAKNKYRTKAGKLQGADYPLSIVQADHSTIQVCLVDEEERKPIGDAWLTLVIDCYSRMVLGYFLTLDAPSTLSTGMALARAMLPKDELLRELGVEGEWPCWGVPDVFLVDNGADLNGRMIQEARRLFKFTVRNRPVGSPEFGGHVESAFKTFMNESKATPGTKRSNPVDRAEYDSEGRAILTIREYERLLVECIVNDYHLLGHAGDGMNKRAPIQRWRQGVFEGEVFSPTGLPDLPADPMQVRICLMPTAERPIIKGCVQIFSQSYFSLDLETMSRSVDVNAPLDDRKFEIRYDPRNIFNIWVRNPIIGEFVSAEAQGVDWTRRTLWENRAIRKHHGSPDEEYKDSRFKSLLARDGIKESARKKTKQVRLQNEKAKLHAQHALVKPPPKPSIVPKTAKPTHAGIDAARREKLRSRVRPADSGDEQK